MQKGIYAGTLIILWAGTLQGGGVTNLIFHSGFEGTEACATFDGLGDTIIVPTVNITGAFSLNGENFPISEYDDAVFSLRDRASGDVFELGNSHDVNYDANIVPGRYDVMYSVETPGANVPHNVNAVVMENVALLADGTLDIDVTAHQLSGDFLLNGGPFPASEYDDAIVFLDGEQAGRVQLGETKLQSYANVPVIAGDYEIRYQVETPSTVPWNQWGLVGVLTVAGNATEDINVQSVELSGSFSHNGEEMPASEYDDGNFYLETAEGDRVFLENSHWGSYQKHVITGNYDIYWELETQGDTVPFNLRARIGSNINIGTGKLDISMSSFAVSGDFSLNGNAFPGTFQHTGRIVFRDQVTGTENELAQTQDGAYSHQVVRGAYDVVYQHLQGEQVPQNKNAHLSSLVVKSDQTVDVDVGGRFFAAPIYHNGALFPADQQQIASIILREPAGVDRALLGRTSQQNLSAMVVPGTYDVYYSHLNGDEIPQNTMARFMSGLIIDPPGPVLTGGGGGGIVLEVNSVSITGQMLLNDAPMPALEYDDGLIHLRRQEDSVLVANTHDQTYQVRVVNQEDWAEFLVHYGVESRGDTVPWNGDAQVMCILLDPIVL